MTVLSLRIRACMYAFTPTNAQRTHRRRNESPAISRKTTVNLYFTERIYTRNENIRRGTLVN